VKAPILTVALLCLTATARAQFSSNDLLESCRSLLDQNYNPIENLMKHEGNADTAGILYTFRLHETRAMCLATVAAVRAVMDLERGSPPGRVKLACVPYSVTNGQLVRVVVAYADKHPNFLHLSLSGLTILALAEAWPCPAK
jgi:Rap1a immunity proteins